jgi:hypothetical protein
MLMKKKLCFLFCLCLLCTSALGCSPKKTDSEGGENAGKRVDVDITLFSNTMAYAQVFNILTDPRAYLGKRIKVRGSYKPSPSDATGSDTADKYFHHVIIEDIGCCPQAFQFKREGNYSYPEDYPKENAAIEIVGIFTRYEGAGQRYFYLSVESLTIVRDY